MTCESAPYSAQHTLHGDGERFVGIVYNRGGFIRRAMYELHYVKVSHTVVSGSSIY